MGDANLIPAPVPARRPLAVLPWLLFIGALASTAFLGWQLTHPTPNGDPLAVSLSALERQDRLMVFSAQLAPIVASDDTRLFGLVKSHQVAVIPARVDYFVELAAMRAERMKWDAVASTLSVRLPPVGISRPNLDEARAQYLREGVWITRDAQDKLTRDNTRLAEKLALEQAGNPVLMDLARDAATNAIQQNLGIPLQVAGFGNVKINVSFDIAPTRH